MISLEDVQCLVSFDPATGVFTWNVDRTAGVRAGDRADKWGPGGYLRICLNGKRYRAHRVAWLYVTGHWPVQEIDHIDGNRANNAIANLRDVPREINLKNKRRYRTCSSDHMGVRRASYGKWHAQLAGRYLGSFASFDEAVACRVSAERTQMFHQNHGGIAP